MRSVFIKIHINYFQWLLLLCYILTSLLLTLYLIPGFQAVSIKLSNVRDTYNKEYVAQLLIDIVFGLNIITIVQGVHFNLHHFKLEYIFKFPAKNIDQPLIRKLYVCHFIYNKNQFIKFIFILNTHV